MQGVLAASAIRQKCPGLPTTESHPRVLRFLLGRTLPDDMLRRGEHERDAALATISGWASIHRSAGWRDLYQDEADGYFPIDSPVSYWMPL